MPIGSPYLPLDTIQASDLLIIERLKYLLKIDEPLTPRGSCATMVQLIHEVLGWEIWSVKCRLQRLYNGEFWRHAVNLCSEGVLFDSTLEQFNTQMPGSLVSPVSQDLKIFIANPIESIVLLPFDTPVFEIDEIATDELRKLDLNISARIVLHSFDSRKYRHPYF